MPSIREQLIGAWELIKFAAWLPDNVADKKYPMGPNCKGIIMYTPDGYMSAQLMPSKDDIAEKRAAVPYTAYTGHFYLDEVGDKQGPLMFHEMRLSDLPMFLGDVQRRLVKIEDEADGRYLTLGVEGLFEWEGEQRIARVRWKRLPENHATSPPKL